MTAKKKQKINKQTTTPPKAKPKTTNGVRINFLIATLLLLFSLALLLSFISYFTSGAYDQSIVGELNDRSLEPKNWVGKLGAWLSHQFIFSGFGIASFIFVKIFAETSLWFAFKFRASKLRQMMFWDLFALLVISIALGHFGTKQPYLGGVVGYEINDYLQDYLGQVGALMVVVFFIIFFLVFRIKMSPSVFTNVLSNTRTQLKDSLGKAEQIIHSQPNEPAKDTNVSVKNETVSIEKTVAKVADTVAIKPVESSIIKIEDESENQIDFDLNPSKSNRFSVESSSEIPHNEEFIIETIEEETLDEDVAAKIVEDFGLYDPTLELSKYQFPTSDLLIDHASGGITINQAELEENKNRIVETLNNYKIGIAQIKATVGPTVTLYEIVPEAGIRISKIKSLEDDIALSLSALGIRIIAPIPGKGTIGIEVPNTKPTTVSMKSLILSPKFQNAEMELHFLAKLPDTEDAIITDNTKVIHTLNSLCIEMDNRYSLLKDAMVRNIKEYNEKFKQRKLNPENGHRFLPYIVLVVDEFADLIMTAGKEVETPIARLAQLARAIGIHLIIATQRPSVNVITGIIKANFPARIAFRVSSKIDSRTILDGP